MKTFSSIFIAAIAACTMSAPVHAKDVQLQLHGVSHHFEDRANGKWNEANYGIGIRFAQSETARLQAGYFKNSVNKDTFYIIGDYLPIQVGAVKAGAFIGLGTGYNKPFLGGLVVDAQITSTITLSTRIIPEVKGETPAVIAFEIGFKF